MKSLSAMELAIITKELKEVLLGAKIDKIYLLPKEQELLLQIHISGVGKKILRISAPNVLFLSDYKPETPQRPHGFCMFLRKRLKNARINGIEQIDFERILDITFQTKEDTFHLIVELFSKGNFILCDAEYKIISPFSNQQWKDRVVRGGVLYEHPSLKHNFLTLTKEQLGDLTKTSDKESVVKVLALELGLGGVFAEQICTNAGIDKNKKEISEEEISKLIEQIQIFQKLEFKPYDANQFSSFNESLDKELTHHSIKQQQHESTKESSQKLNKTQRIIKQQSKTVEKLEQDAQLNQQKAELIYSHYQSIKAILEQLEIARDNMTWKEIKEKLKDHKVIKEINEKNKQIILELE